MLLSAEALCQGVLPLSTRKCCALQDDLSNYSLNQAPAISSMYVHDSIYLMRLQVLMAKYVLRRAVHRS
jgi:hypothetical protein